MGTKDLFSPDAKLRVREAVAAIEAQTSAEIVVALRKRSGHYRHTDYLVGAVLALAVLCVFLYHPEPFEFTYLPLELLGCFAFGALMSAYFPPIQRLFTARRLLDESVRTAARALFVEKGVSKTRGRTGILVYLSLLEQRVEVVADAGVAEGALGPDWVTAKGELARLAARGATLDQLIQALRKLGPPLAEALPRAADDVNELSDEVAS